MFCVCFCVCTCTNQLVLSTEVTRLNFLNSIVMGQINQCGFQSHVAIDRYCIFLEINTFELSWVELNYIQCVNYESILSISSYQHLITGLCANTGSSMKGNCGVSDLCPLVVRASYIRVYPMMTSSNGNIFRVLALCAGNSPVPVNSPHKGQWRGALMFSLICVWINGWVNNRGAGDLRRYRGHYDVNVMLYWDSGGMTYARGLMPSLLMFTASMRFIWCIYHNHEGCR